MEHYNQKYRNSSYADVKPVPIVRRPRDRFEMAARAAFCGTGKYLEIGAGSGNIALTVLEKYDEIVLTELSNVRIQELSKLFRNDLRVKVIKHNFDNDALDCPDGYFDTIVMVAVIEHLLGPKSALIELSRVLKPGGRLLLDTPNIAKWTEGSNCFLVTFRQHHPWMKVCFAMTRGHQPICLMMDICTILLFVL